MIVDGNNDECTVIPKLVAGNVMIGTAMETLKKHGLTHMEYKVLLFY